MYLQARDCKCIGSHEAAESPVLPEDVGQQPAISTRGDVVQIHVGAHQATCALLHRGVKRNQVDVPHQFFRNVRSVVVSPSLCCSISREVFDTCYHAIRPEADALESPHLGPSHRGPEIWVLAGSFLNSTPTCIASNVHHRRERPPDPCSPSLIRRECLRLFLDRGIPRRSHPERYWEEGAIAMDHVQPKEQRDVQATLLDGEMLHPIHHFGICQPEDGADTAVDDVIV